MENNYYINYVKSIEIYFENGDSCIINDVFDSNLDLDKRICMESTLEISSHTYNTILHDYFNYKIKIKRIEIIYDISPKKVFNKEGSMIKSENELKVVYYTNAYISQYNISVLENLDPTNVSFKIEGDFHV